MQITSLTKFYGEQPEVQSVGYSVRPNEVSDGSGAGLRSLRGSGCPQSQWRCCARLVSRDPAEPVVGMMPQPPCLLPNDRSPRRPS